MIRVLSARRPLALAVDDAQWLDGPSARALEFCVRRLERQPIALLLTLRTEDQVPLKLDQALPPERVKRFALGPLTLGVIGEILRSRLGAALPRYTLTQLYETCQGNPFYALECARSLLEHRDTLHPNEPFPIPPNLRDLLRGRIRRLTSPARLAGQMAAACPDPRERLIRAALDDTETWAAIDEAVSAGIIARDGDSLRFTHPLMRSALYAEMTPRQRMNVHERLAAAAEDVQERAWHLGRAADRPSEEIAAMLDTAAQRAASRGAPETAAALQEQATRLTPASRPQQASARTVRAAEYHFWAGSMTRSQALIESALSTSQAGAPRATLLTRLGTILYHQDGWPAAEEAFRSAALEAANDPKLRAHAEQELAFARMIAGDLPDALRMTSASLRSAEQAADPGLIAHSLARLAAFEFLAGHGMRSDLLDRAEALHATAGEDPPGRLPLVSPSLTRALLLKWSDQLDEARLMVTAEYRRALHRGDEASLPFLLHHFSEIECWTGNWDSAEEYALEGCRVADECHQQAMKPATFYSLALIRAHRGQVTEARDMASKALGLCEQTGNVPVATQVLSLLGFIELSLDDHFAAHSYLGRLAEMTAALGLGEPGVVRFLPDEIEALAALGNIDLARSFTDALEQRGNSLGRPWALATSARCRAVLAAADGEPVAAQMACERALEHHERLPMPFELGRTLLVRGIVERRARHKSAARTSLTQARVMFQQLGAPLWAEKASRELSKIAKPCRQLGAGGLTETERRVADLVARGRTNREVALAMFVTENTVQTHIRHIFQKLGVRSRTELAAQLLSKL
jgi:DNA-binding CsgD family transcriptional regulator